MTLIFITACYFTVLPALSSSLLVLDKHSFHDFYETFVSLGIVHLVASVERVDTWRGQCTRPLAIGGKIYCWHNTLKRFDRRLSLLCWCKSIIFKFRSKKSFSSKLIKWILWKTFSYIVVGPIIGSGRLTHTVKDVNCIFSFTHFCTLFDKIKNMLGI